MIDTVNIVRGPKFLKCLLFFLVALCIGATAPLTASAEGQKGLESRSPDNFKKEFEKLRKEAEKLESELEKLNQLPAHPPAVQPSQLAPPQSPELGSFPGLSGQTYKNLPPLLQRLRELSDRVCCDYNTAINAHLMNQYSEEILTGLTKIYSEAIEVPQDFMVMVRFARETTGTIVESGAVETRHDNYTFRTSVTYKLIWLCTYIIEVAKSKGHFLGFSLYNTQPSQTMPADVEFFGEIEITSPADPHPRLWVPIDGHRVYAGGTVHIVPDLENLPASPSAWPENVQSPYIVVINQEPVYLYSAKDPNQHRTATCKIYPIPFNLSQEDLKTAAERGRFRYRFTLGEIVGTVMRCFEEEPAPDQAAKSEGKSGSEITGTVERCVEVEMGHSSQKGLMPESQGCTDYDITVHVNLPPLGRSSMNPTMPGALALGGDCIDHGGYLLTTQNTVFVNGRPIARVGDPVMCSIHGITRIAAGADTSVYSSGKPIAKIGDITECGARIRGGSWSTFAEKK